MSIFDLLFLAAIAVTVILLLATVLLALKGSRTRALKSLQLLAVFVCAYAVASMAVSFFAPQHLISMGEPWCFDDWCLAADQITSTAQSNTTNYQVELRLSSTARGRPQRASGAWIYLIDGQGNLYPPITDKSEIPLDVLLQPQESISTSRTFHVPSNITPVGLVTGHGGPYCGAMSWLIIGQGGCLFGRPTMVRLK